MEKSGKSVYAQVNDFLRLTWLPENDTINPLKIQWGEFSFHCRLKDVEIKYTLFDRMGAPLRAELDANFIGIGEENQDNYRKRLKAPKKAAK